MLASLPYDVAFTWSPGSLSKHFFVMLAMPLQDLRPFDQALQVAMAAIHLTCCCLVSRIGLNLFCLHACPALAGPAAVSPGAAGAVAMVHAVYGDDAMTQLEH
jgi:hypothetical protein